MSGLAILALVLACVWLGILTLVVVLLVRQIGLLTVRLSVADQTPSLDHDGPEVGSEVPENVVTLLPELKEEQLTYLLLASATCGSCREVIADIEGHYFEQQVTVLMPGPEKLANELSALLPSGVRAVLDPEAITVAEALEIQTTPFAVEVEGGTVKRKAYLWGRGSDFIKFVKQEPLPATTGGVGIERKEEVVSGQKGYTP
jgi:hypothetical protein